MSFLFREAFNLAYREARLQAKAGNPVDKIPGFSFAMALKCLVARVFVKSAEQMSIWPIWFEKLRKHKAKEIGLEDEGLTPEQYEERLEALKVILVEQLERSGSEQSRQKLKRV